MRVQIYVEGGGDQDRTLTQCRKAFHSLFEKVCPEGQRPRFIACGGRDSAYGDFCNALKSKTDYYSVLLVDSEGPIAVAMDAWVFLKERDHWNRPPGSVKEQAQLMAQCMESWFLADKTALVAYYGQGFLLNSLPQNPNIEEIPKVTVSGALEHATRPTQKREYQKVRHGFDILAKLNFTNICNASPRARAFRDIVLMKLVE